MDFLHLGEYFPGLLLILNKKIFFHWRLCLVQDSGGDATGSFPLSGTLSDSGFLADVSISVSQTITKESGKTGGKLKSLLDFCKLKHLCNSDP